MSTARKFARDVLGRTLLQTLSALRGVILLPLLARAYGAAGYGVWSQVTLTAALVAPLVNLRLNEAVVRYLGGIEPGAPRRHAFNSCLVVTWGLGGLALLLGTFGAPLLARAMFGDPSMERFVLLFLGLLVAGVSFGLATSYYRAISHITINTGLQAAELLLSLAAATVFSLVLRLPLESVLAAIIGINLVLSVACVLDIARREGGLGVDWRWMRRLLKYSLPLMPAAALYWIIDSSDRFVIVHVMDLEHAGAYSAAYRLARVVKLIVEPLSFVLLPLMANLWGQKQEREALAYLYVSLRIYLLIAVPAVAGLAAVGAPLLTSLAAREAFSVSPSLIAVLAASSFCAGLYQIWVYVLYMKERNVVLLMYFALSATLNLGGNLLLIPRIGLLGAAWTTLLAYALQASLVIAYARRLTDVPFPWSLALRTCIAGGLVYATVQLLPGQSLPALLLRIAAGVTVYAALAGVLRLVRREDFAWLRGQSAARPPTK